MNSTKIVGGLLAFSLVANLALAWMLWQQRHLEKAPSIATSTTKAQVKETPPASVVESAIHRAPRIEPPLPPPTRGGKATTKNEAVLFSHPRSMPKVDLTKIPAYLRLELPEDRAYGPPPPPNPYAVPPWHERLPYREDQLERGLYSTPLKLDK